MSVQWVAVQSFQHSQDLLTAINALSIHLKLAQAGIPANANISQVIFSLLKPARVFVLLIL